MLAEMRGAYSERARTTPRVGVISEFPSPTSALLSREKRNFPDATRRGKSTSDRLNNASAHFGGLIRNYACTCARAVHTCTRVRGGWLEQCNMRLYLPLFRTFSIVTVYIFSSRSDSSATSAHCNVTGWRFALTRRRRGRPGGNGQFSRAVYNAWCTRGVQTYK